MSTCVGQFLASAHHCRYCSDDADVRKVRRVIRSLGALSFLPEAEVVPSFYALRVEITLNDPVRDILSSFADTYLGYTWDDVRFPIKFWSVLDRFRNNQPRINNTAEGWHYRFNSLHSGAHPPMYKSIEKLIEEETQGRLEADKVRRGIYPPKKAKSIQIEGRLELVLENRENQVHRDNTDFLNEVKSCLHEFLEF